MLVERIHPSVPLAPGRTRPDERAARRSLREQVARLEEEHVALACSAWPRTDVVPAPQTWRGGEPRLLSLAELEHLRDELAVRVGDLRRALDERGREEERNRRLLEEMLLQPEEHGWVQLGNEDFGEPGCRHWHVRPRFGLLGMLLKWWRVRISSGCPLPGLRPAARDHLLVGVELHAVASGGV
jgi:hypothetical protein